MAVDDIPVESLYIAGGVCGGIILILSAILLFFCCAPKRKPRRPQFEPAESHRRAQGITVNTEPQESSKPFARVAPTHQTPSAPPMPDSGVENFGAELSDSFNDRRQLYPCDPLGASCQAPPQYVEVTEDHFQMKSSDPPPTYSSSLNRKWQSTGHLEPMVLSVANLQNPSLYRGYGSQAALDAPDGYESDATQSRKAKRVVYEVVV